MIGSLLDVVRFFEKVGIPHRVVVQRPAVLFTFNKLQMVLRWEPRLRKVFACRLDEDSDRVVDRMSLAFDDAGKVSEPALLHLITAAAKGAAVATTLPPR